jgi:group I intron endonuclease
MSWNNCGVYQIRNLVNGKVYVGSSEDISSRWKVHLRLIARGNHHSIKLQNAFRKYGQDNFAFEIINHCSENDLLFFEQLFINANDSFRKGYNMSEVAGSPMKNRKHSVETRAKMSKSGKGRPKSEDHRKAIGRGNLGKKMSKESIDKQKPSRERRKLLQVGEFDPQLKAIQTKKLCEYNSSDAGRQRVAEITRDRMKNSDLAQKARDGQTRFHENPENILNQTRGFREYANLPETRALRAAQLQQRMKDPDYLAKIQEGQRRYWEKKQAEKLASKSGNSD